VLQINDIHVGYDETPVLRGVSLEVNEGEVVAVIGSNGAGKTTLMRAVSGIRPPTSGQIHFEDNALHALAAHKIATVGIAHVPEGRGLFAQQTVLRNLQLGAFLRTDQEREETLEQVFDLFPRLAERITQQAGTLSGGEQQMLAIGRGLMSRPRLLMLDEPSLGLAPVLVDEVFELIQRLNQENQLTIMLVEQNVRESLEIADRAYVLQTGKVVLSGKGEDLVHDDTVQKAYLGL